VTAQLLPRHDPVSWRDQAATSQRDRLLVALAESVVELGYPNTRVADVIARAGVSRRTFYEHFTDLEDCFLATYDRGVEVLSNALAGGLTEAGTGADWREVLARLLATYLEVLAAEPVFSQFAMVEVLGAGPAARARYLEVVDRFHDLLRMVDALAGQQDPTHPSTTDLALSFLAGGLSRLVMTETLAGRGRELMTHYDGLLQLGVQVMGGSAA
jgi:AcrR family transcriptional regulator